MFPGVHFGNLFNMFIRVTGANIGIYISVLPIILLFCCSVNNFLGGVALAFVYGYFGTFEGTLLNYYPIKASMILVDVACDAKYGVIYQIISKATPLYDYINKRWELIIFMVFLLFLVWVLGTKPFVWLTNKISSFPIERVFFRKVREIG